MNNSNFGYDCRNKLDNCKFVHSFDEFRELTYVNGITIFLIKRFPNLLLLIYWKNKLKKIIIINVWNLIRKIDFMKLNYKL